MRFKCWLARVEGWREEVRHTSCWLDSQFPIFGVPASGGLLKWAGDISLEVMVTFDWLLRGGEALCSAR
jgi:hypothetical protein